MSRPIRTLLGLAAAGLLAATSVNLAAAAAQPDTSTQRIRATRQVLILPGGQIVVRMVERTAESFRAIPTDGGNVDAGVIGDMGVRLRQPGGDIPEVSGPALLLPGLAGLDEQPRQTVLERRLATFTGFTGATTPNPPGILLVTDWGDGAKARLTWSDDFINETSYRIERQTSVAGVWGSSRYFTSSADIVDVVDTPGAGTHRYRVAVDAWGGSSAFGDWVTLTITDPNNPPPPPPDDPDPPVGGAPATPTGLMAASAGNGRVLLTWTDNADNETGYRIERNPALPEGASLVSANIVSYLDTAAPGSYQYRVRAENGAGESPFTPWVSVFVPELPPEPPSNPFVVSQGNGSAILFTWTDNSNNEAGFLAVRESFDGLNWGSAETFAVAANAVSMTDTPGLGQHRYRVRAANSAGASEFTPWAQVTVSDIAPSAPINLAAADMGDGLRTQLTWSDRSTNELAFDIEREQFSGGQWGSRIAGETLANRESFIDAPGLGQWRYRVRARNDVGASVWTSWTEVTVAMIAPAAPQNLIAQDAGTSGEVQLSWLDESNNEAGFELARETQFGASWINPVTVTLSANTTTHRDNPGVGVFRYRLRAVNSAGNSAFTTWTQVTVALQPPAAPSGLAAMDLGDNSNVRITWTDNSSNETGFDLQRQTQSGGNWSSSTTVSLGANLTQRTEARGPGTYRYRIRSKNGAGQSAYTGWVNVTVVDNTPQPPAPPSGINAVDAGSRRASITWVDNSSDETAFELERQPSFSQGSVLVSAGVTGYVDQSGPGTFSYRVRATSAAGASAWTGYATVTVQETPPAAPSGLTAADAGNENDATLTWSDNSFNETAFTIERQSQVGAAWGESQFITAGADLTTYRDDPGAGTHRYRLAATNAAGDSSWTAWATVVITSGWTQFTPSADTRIVYVSSSEGNDANDGLSEATPKRTIAAGYALLRNGYPDWLLLKRGDVWNEVFQNFNKSGRSETAYMVVATYGNAHARPLIRAGTSVGITRVGGGETRFVAFTGLHLVANGRTAADSPSGFRWVGGGGDVLLEDLKIDGFKDNISLDGYTGSLENVRIRRCIVIRSWSSGSHSQGLYSSKVNGLLVEECLFDQNGWNPDAASGGVPTIYNHNLYVQTSNQNVTIRKNIITRASSHGLQLRCGGTVTGNVFSENSIAILLGGGSHSPPETHRLGVSGNVTDNIVLEGKDISDTLPRGFGIDLTNIGMNGATVARNIIANKLTDSPSTSIGLIGSSNGAGVGYNNVIVSDNIVYNWRGEVGLTAPASTPPSPSEFCSVSGVQFTRNAFQEPDPAGQARLISAFSSSAFFSSENIFYSSRADGLWFRINGSNLDFALWRSQTSDVGSVVREIQFRDPGRTIGTYSQSLGIGPSIADFIAEAELQQRGNWRAELLATAISAYIRDGFSEQ